MSNEMTSEHHREDQGDRGGNGENTKWVALKWPVVDTDNHVENKATGQY